MRGRGCRPLPRRGAGRPPCSARDPPLSRRARPLNPALGHAPEPEALPSAQPNSVGYSIVGFPSSAAARLVGRSNQAFGTVSSARTDGDGRYFGRVMTPVSRKMRGDSRRPRGSEWPCGAGSSRPVQLRPSGRPRNYARPRNVAVSPAVRAGASDRQSSERWRPLWSKPTAASCSLPSPRGMEMSGLRSRGPASSNSTFAAPSSVNIVHRDESTKLPGYTIQPSPACVLPHAYAGVQST